jgi:predicted NAD/FAD-dependent oxidoreductase
MTRTLVIGAGMAGIACARALQDAGRPVRVIDKGRGIGGRMATRRAETPAGQPLRFDHGAQYVTARDPGFAALLEGSQAAAVWADGAAHPHHVGLPGMSGLPRALADGLDVSLGVTVTAVRRAGPLWQVATQATVIEAERVVLTVPAPQVAALIGADHPLAARLDAVRIAPGLTLMAAFPADAPAPFASRRFEDGPLAFIARDSSKPGRPDGAVTWVAQAGPAWSTAHLDEDTATIAQRMLPLLCAEIGAAADSALYTAAHRWRYARVTTPLGQPFLTDATGTLQLGGDWCLAGRVEAAWTSGRAIAEDIMGGDDA